MMADEPRRRGPKAFRIDETDERAAKPTQERERADTAPRQPRAVGNESAVTYVETADDPFAEADALAPPPAEPKRRSLSVRSVFFSVLGLLISLAIGLWVDELIRELFARAEWLGWTASALAALAVGCLLFLVIREVWTLTRLASVHALQRRSAAAIAAPSAEEVRSLSADLSRFLADKKEAKSGRAELARHADEIIDAPDLLTLTERELLGELDRKAVTLILDAAKRTSVVTAVSPRALIDVAYVVFEAARLIRRMAELYGGRPGTLGFVRLSRDVLGHLAITGSITVGDSLVQQLVGHGVAAKLSARFGEGIINGLMTVRVGIAAMEVVRPMPFNALQRPAMSTFLKELTRFAAKEAEAGERRS